MINLSTYAKELPLADRIVYYRSLEGHDDHMKKSSQLFTPHNYKAWPDIHWGDIVNYFIDKTSLYTSEQFRSFKSLEAYSYHYDGWLQEIYSAASTENVIILKADVRASQRNIFHKAWMLVKKTGEIITAHCSCMAG